MGHVQAFHESLNQAHALPARVQVTGTRGREAALNPQEGQLLEPSLR